MKRKVQIQANYHGRKLAFSETNNDKDSVKLAKKNELDKLKDFDTYEEVENSGQKKLSTRWVITTKEGRVKARLVARGFEEDFFLFSEIALPSVKEL